MQSTSTLYRQILTTQGHWKEIKVDIAGVEYGDSDILSLSTSGGLYSSFSVGNCISREIDIELIPKGTIPRMAQMDVYVRLVTDTLQSEWIQKGTFFIDTRVEDTRTGVLTIHGFDSMLKAEQLWNGNINTYHFNAVPAIATRMGITVDSRTELNKTYRILSDDGYTMREILGYIAAANAGNFIITDKNQLLLVKVGDIEAQTSLLIDDFGNRLLFGEVRIIV